MQKTIARIIVVMISLYWLGAGTVGSRTATASPTDRQRAEQAADQFMVSNRSLQQAGTQLVRVQTIAGDPEANLFYVTYQRSVQNRRVVGGESIVVARGDGTITTITSSAMVQLPTAINSSISPSQALVVAQTLFTHVTQASKPELVIYARNVATPVSAYHLQLQGTITKAAHPARSFQDIYLDANTGVIIATEEHAAEVDGQGYYNGKVDIDVSPPTMSSRTAIGVDCQVNNKTVTFNGNPGNGDALNPMTQCVDIVYAAEQEKKMLTDWLGRDGMDGRGAWVPAHADLDEANAYYSGDATYFGHNLNKTKRLTAMDIVAHEYGHGIYTHTGIGNNNGLSESYSDIFATLTEAFADNAVDRPDFTIGEEVDLLGDHKPFRYLYNPELAPHDDTDKHPIHPNCYRKELEEDYEAHAAAGPWNHFFYLLAEGSNPGGNKPNSPTCNNSTVQGIGVKNAGRIVYAALQRHISSRYDIYRNYALSAAKDLFPHDDCQTYIQTKTALDAAGFPIQPDEPSCQSSAPTKPPSAPPTKPVTTSPSVTEELTNQKSVPVTIKGGEQKFYRVTIPYGAKNLKIKLSASSGDADLYVVRRGIASTRNYDCRPWLNSANESCSFKSPRPGAYSIMIDARSDKLADLAIVATWQLT